MKEKARAYAKLDRAKRVNDLIRVIAGGGRNFFKYKDRYAKIEVDCWGKIWWIDEYTEKRIYTHYNGRWNHFSNGGTLRDLVKYFRNFVSKGELIHKGVFGPWPKSYCDGDLWGYGEYMQKIREKARQLEMINY